VRIPRTGIRALLPRTAPFFSLSSSGGEGRGEEPFSSEVALRFMGRVRWNFNCMVTAKQGRPRANELAFFSLSSSGGEGWGEEAPVVRNPTVRWQADALATLPPRYLGGYEIQQSASRSPLQAVIGRRRRRASQIIERVGGIDHAVGCGSVGGNIYPWSLGQVR